MQILNSPKKLLKSAVITNSQEPWTKMLSFKPTDYDIRQRHQYIIGAVGPRPIAWASTVNAEGKVNLAPYSFFNAFGSNPATLVFSSNRRGRDNTTKDTLHNIEATHEVVINIVPYDLVYQMNICSTDFDAEVNEFTKAGVTELASDVVKPPRVKESPVQLECKVNEIIHVGEEGGAPNLFICEIVKMHICESVLDEHQQIDPQKLRLVARMGLNYYTKAFDEAVFEIDNPVTVQNLGFDQLPEHIVGSEFLTGNEIAHFAMETSFPTEEEMNGIASSYSMMSIAEKHNTAKTWLKQGNIREAFALLMK